MGDSHAGVFAHVARLLPAWRWSLEIVEGATVSGLRNPNSATGAGDTFRQAARTWRGDAIVTLLGEVDLGFVIWWRAARREVTVRGALRRAVANYCELLEECAARARAVVVSAPLPTIADGQEWGEVANLRREVRASQRERTELTLDFNAAVERWCWTNGCAFVDLDGESMGPDGLVRADLLHPDPLNHHYEPERYARMLAPRLEEVLG